MANEAGQEIIEFALPEGPEVACINHYETVALWEEIDGDSPYAAAVDGLTQDEMILDVGAHIGLASVFFAQRIPGVRILSFEPAGPMAECLERNLAKHVENGTPLKVAVGAEEGEREFFHYTFMSSKSTMYTDDVEEELNMEVFMANAGFDEGQKSMLRQYDRVRERSTVEVTTLTRAFEQYDIKNVGLLKIDVERAELDVLEGLDEELWPRVRRLLVEVHDTEGRLGKIVGSLAARGYEVRVTQAPAFSGGTIFMVFATRG
ncbi:FkbM family methyltransferase [Streptomyces sp. NPDC001530]|uniref:FkbM family methyltransferase n=1 Tax=Streptomyces sp. NPDC001530 TaxID=3364582 RepID=UPI0036777FDC